MATTCALIDQNKKGKKCIVHAYVCKAQMPQVNETEDTNNVKNKGQSSIGKSIK